MTRERAEIDDPSEMPSPLLPIISAATFSGRPIPPRRWLIRDLIPDRAVTLLTGDGGVGKGLLAAQLAVAVATQTQWLGLAPSTGPAVHLSAEDDEDEMHRRLAEIVAGSGALRLDHLTDVHILPLAGRDAILASTGANGIVCPSSLWRSILDRLAVIRPRLLIIENLADTFAGNEISRSEARQFIGLLRAAAMEFDIAVVLIAHPSLTGMSTGTGTSGSTAWSNSVRSRLYLDRIKTDKGELDPDLRVLRLLKANYAPTGTEVRIRFRAGRFVQEDGHSSVAIFDRISAERHADRLFLKLLSRLASEGRNVSDKPSSTYAPTTFASEPGTSGVGKAAFEAAMKRLFAAKQIRVQTDGPPSRPRSRIVISDAPSNGLPTPSDDLSTACPHTPLIPPVALERPSRLEGVQRREAFSMVLT